MEQEITQITRRALFDSLRQSGIFYIPYEIDEVEFWNRLYNLDELPTRDHRFENMAKDMWQHRVNNPDDWDDYWFLSDDRVNLMTGSDKELLHFLTETIHPLVRVNEDEIATLLRIYNQHLINDGYQIIVSHQVSGKNIYLGGKIKMNTRSDKELNYRLIAIQAGDSLKYNTTVNDVDRAAQSVFAFQCEPFPNDTITSVRAKRMHDWILTLAKQEMDNAKRNKHLIQFLNLITPEDSRNVVDSILEKGGVFQTQSRTDTDFSSRNFHSEIHRHCTKLYHDGNYFHAVFEAAKVYDRKVQQKSRSQKSGQPLMMEVWSPAGVLKVTACQTENDKNIQDGIKFLSAGLMQAMRNPTAHEPAMDWPISKEDCLDMLSFMSYLFRQLEKAQYFK